MLWYCGILCDIVEVKCKLVMLMWDVYFVWMWVKYAGGDVVKYVVLDGVDRVNV